MVATVGMENTLLGVIVVIMYIISEELAGAVLAVMAETADIPKAGKAGLLVHVS